MVFKHLRAFIWSESFWFPKQLNLTWDDLAISSEKEDLYLPKIDDLHWTVFLGVVFLAVRYFYEIFLVVPLGRKLGIKETKDINISANPILEDAYLQKPKLDDTSKKELSKKSDLPVREVEVWFRKRAKRDSSSDMKKFRECGWLFLFYGGAFIYGLSILWNKPWFTNTSDCWSSWPKQHVSDDIYWYYAVELGFYWSLVFTLFSDHKRKDFRVMTIHHLTTIILIYFSWVLNFVRVGTLVLIVHDFPDIWLAVTKMAVYSKHERLTDICFGVFATAWFTSRHILFPFKVLYCTTFEVFAVLKCGHWGGYSFFNGFLYLLQILHIYWSIMLVRAVIQKFKTKEVHDTRSDEESDDI